jgi:hypothetical protein
MTSSTRLTALFLGSGASVEVGMPLVGELTEELKQWLTPDKLRDLNVGWRMQGTGYPDTVIEDFATVLACKPMHYESLLGYLETQSRRVLPLLQQYHGLYSWLVEMVYHIFRLRHTNNIALIDQNLSSFEGIAKLAHANAPLWIFSLNHDVVIECLAAKYDIPLHSGFSSGLIALPRRDASGTKIGELRAETLSEAQLAKGIVFAQPGVAGINLLKIHGALDVFAYRDGKDFAKLVPDERTVQSIIDMLRIAQDELLYVDPQRPYPVKATNEIAFADEMGVMQFLRRSLVAGTHKFDNRHGQVLPKEFFKQFESDINFVSTLICIGYGFGDLHINRVLCDWLERTPDRRLEIVSPGASIPAFLLHLSPQVAVFTEAASDYLDRTTGIVRSRREISQRRLGAWFRKNRKDPQVQQKFLIFIQERQDASFRDLLEQMRRRYPEGGGVESETVDGIPVNCAKQLAEVNELSFDTLVEEFLGTQSSGL